ncbi:sulfite exporter TauE/SafE family protein, partial [Clostridioides difficile]|nr:sulfite exporter TauE/SafE family protein [Clostridioides difficile]
LSSIPMTLIALAIHIKNKNVIFKLVIPIAVFGVLGAVFGSLLANYLSSDILKKIFGIFLLLVGLFEVKKGFCAKSDKKPLN